MNKLALLANLIKGQFPDFTFSAMEVGALPLAEESEPMHDFMEVFPESKLYAFEPDEDLCKKLNLATPANIKYIPKALGKENEMATLHITADRTCYSLYEPNEDFFKLYYGMDALTLVDTTPIETFKLDSLISSGEVASPDTIKIDVQGAELDIFKGGETALESALLVITEAEFGPLYKDQPLFPDVFSYMKERGFMFHKFDGICGRNLNPVNLGGHINKGSQLLWSDAVFIKDVETLSSLDSLSLVKLAVFCVAYRSMDVTYFCLDLVDQKENTKLAESFMKILNA